MAVETVKASVQSTEDIINAAVARSKAVMARQWAVYDHEKVFWNSVWTVGIIGLGWVSVKLGMIIMSTASIGKGMELATSDVAQFELIYSYVEGDKSDPNEYPLTTFETDFWGSVWAAVTGGLLPGGIGVYNVSTEALIKSVAAKLRKDPELWAKTKAQFMADYKTKYGKDWVPPEKTPAGLSLSVLEQLDKFFNTFGPILPFAAVAGHMGLESLRVYRIRKKLGKET